MTILRFSDIKRYTNSIRRVFSTFSLNRDNKKEWLQTDFAGTKASPVSKAARLIARAEQELPTLLPKGHSSRLEDLVSILHLSSTYTETLPPDLRRDLLTKSAALLRHIYGVGENSLHAPLRSSSPSAFVVSYPRSGNTMITQVAASVLQGQIMENMDGAFVPFSKKIYSKSYPFPRIIKDHVARDYFRDDRCIFVLRDGRDTVLSLGYMTLQQGLHSFTGKHELPDLIRWLDNEYLFGGWTSHARSVLDLMRQEGKLLIKYDDAMQNHKALKDAIDFIDPGNALSPEAIKRAYDGRDNVFSNIKNNEFANRTWGIDVKLDSESMYYKWSKNRKNSNWQASWSDDAKRTFHETGATDLLIEFGFESDPNWWRD